MNASRADLPALDVNGAAELVEEPPEVFLSALAFLGHSAHKDRVSHVLDNATRGARELLAGHALFAKRIR